MYYNRDLDRERWYHYGKERGFFDRVGDEIRAWFGDEEAERRRRFDEMESHRYGSENRYGQYSRPLHHEEEDRYNRWLRSHSYPRQSSLYGYETHSEYDLPEFERRREIERRELERVSRMGGHPLHREHLDAGQRFYSGQRSDFGREHLSGGMYSGEFMPREEMLNSGRREFGSEMQSNMYGQPIRRDGFGREEELRTGGVFRGRGPKNWQRNDERIKEEINERLTHHPEIDATEIDVIVTHGEVTLKGTVDQRFMKRLTEDLVESISGVRDVHNEIRVTRNMFGDLPTTQTGEKVPAGTRTGTR
jgi:osmotically-inducible protein OsmY